MAGGTVVIALGNAFRGDDGVGPAVAARLAGRLPDAAALRVMEGGALDLIDAWSGAARAILVDAALSGAPAGSVRRLDSADGPLPKDLARCSSHALGVAEAADLSRSLDRLPERLVLYAVEGACFDAGTGLTPPVAAAIEGVARRVLAEIAETVDA